MDTSAISVKSLAKEFRIGATQDNYRTLRDSLTDALVSPFRRAGKLLRGQATGAAELDESFWALKDISFDVKPGEVVGIVGRNGAGKSTLLKLLARITEPTAGSAEIRGRVGSLLEVGTGFHPELTGRENIYLNGAILGMMRVEIDRKFDEIVEFSEVGKFIDTPVKHYSSGMYLRLAFSVAAHLEPDILLVDEVLAVGDAFFQKKCLGKMGDVAKEGRTVLFVSHNMSAIRTLCDRAILIEDGKVGYDGDVNGAVAKYHGLVRAKQSGARPGKVTFSDFRVNGKEALSVANDEPLDLTFTLNVNIRSSFARLWCKISDTEDKTMLHNRIEHYELFDELVPGTYQIRIRIPTIWLRPDLYTIHLKIIASLAQDGGQGRYLADPLILEVQPTEDSSEDLASLGGALTPAITWSVDSSSQEIRNKA